jgi:hypothetical protein
MSVLRRDEDIAAAGAAAVADFPPLTEAQVTTLAGILAPLADDPRWVRLDTEPATSTDEQRRAA